MGLYKVTSPADVLGNEPGAVFQASLSDAEERDLLLDGRIALEPQAWKNIGTNIVSGTEPGGTFQACYTAGQEAALVEAGAIEPADGSTPQPESEPDLEPDPEPQPEPAPEPEPEDVPPAEDAESPAA
jgi:hypothetical protein